MAKIPEPSKTTAKRIHWLYEQKKDEPRPHLGCSIIGHSCDRYIWLSWRWAFEPTFPGRVRRLFNTGHREEERIQSDLRELDIELYTIDEESGKQISVSAVNGHFAGSVDGIGRGFIEAPKSWAVLECKTHNTKSFADLQKKGVATAKRQHYAQMQMYMGLLDLDRAIYIAQCKDDDELYSEWVHFDQESFDSYLARAERLIASAGLPDGISADPAWYECKWCDYQDFCHGDKVALPNCRTCSHATPVKDAAWQCEIHREALTYAKQKEGCKEHIFIPKMIPYADAIDGGENYIEYQVKGTERTFINSPAPGHYLSRELHMLDPSMPGDKTLNEMKDIFGAEVTESKSLSILDMPDDLEPVYAEDKSAKGRKAKAELEKTAAQVKALKGLK
jgi:hypothetical protein